MASQGASPFLIPEILSGNLNFCQEQENKTTSNNCPAGISILSSYDAHPGGNLVEMLSSVQELAGGENSGAGGAFSLLSSTQSCRAEHRPGINEKSKNCMNYSRKCLKASPKRSGPTTTIDLQQLSTHLRRVEQQRSSEQVKNQETIMSSNNVLCCFTSM